MIGILCLGMMMGMMAATAFVALVGGGLWSWLVIYVLVGAIGTLGIAWRHVACRQARETQVLGLSH